MTFRQSMIARRIGAAASALIVASVVILHAQPAAPAAAQPKTSAAVCDRACLLGILSDTLDTLPKHDPSHLPVAANIRVTENGQELKLGDGIWKTVQSFSYRQSFVDPSTGQAGFMGVIEEDATGKATFALRLKVVNRKIAEVETLVARKGAHPMFAPENLVTVKGIWDTQVPPDERSSRSAMIAAVDSYFEAVEIHKPEIIPFHPSCNRTENGMQTTNNPPRMPLDCRDSIAGLTYINHARDRRYPIVDQARGLVFAIMQFDIPGNLASTPPTADKQIQEQLRERRSVLIFELFKVESGRIREIQAFMTNEEYGKLSAWPAAKPE